LSRAVAAARVAPFPTVVTTTFTSYAVSAVKPVNVYPGSAGADALGAPTVFVEVGVPEKEFPLGVIKY
jgi:hypothetical protein